MERDQEQQDWEDDGYFIRRRFAPPETLAAMTERVVEIARAHAAGEPIGDVLPQPETGLAQQARMPEEGLSKMFKLHRQEPIFRKWVSDSAVLDGVIPRLGPNLDCFLSQFIFKMPGAIGQPWHQDGHYFPFDRSPQVGIWLAVTEARLDNGPLWVLPGSHREAIHPTVPDTRPAANLGYVEIVDHDMDGATPVLLEPGDALFFHSHLMHKSTDNASPDRRAAMVFHIAQAETRDCSQEKWGFTPPNIDWMPIRRRIETEVEIAAPIDQVRKMLFDVSNYGNWNPYLVKIDGRLEAGQSITALGRGADGAEMSMAVEVLEVGPDQMRWEGGAPDRSLFLGDHHFELEAVSPNRTRFRQNEDFTGTLIADLWPAQGERIEDNFRRMNEGLRRACESG